MKKLDPKTKQPFAFGLKDAAPLAFAGLWDAWKDPANGEWLQTFTIITTDPNEVTGEVHNRTPVILHAKDHDRWLTLGLNQPPIDLLRPYEAEAMTISAAIRSSAMCATKGRKC